MHSVLNSEVSQTDSGFELPSYETVRQVQHKTRAITDCYEYTTYPCFVKGNRDVCIYKKLLKGA